jgi:putative spermidine/putrescine transport system substrate-binding protein/spermidine/putrescine transport system substrate-binding protein
MLLDRNCSVLAVFAASLLAGSARVEAGELNLLTWEGYADPSFAKPFEQQSGCRVTATYVGTNDEFVAKVMGGGADYDLVSPSNDTTQRLIDAGAIDPVDSSKVPAMKDFFPIFQAPPWLSKNGRVYGVPYGWGIVRTIVRADAVSAVPDSLNFLWEARWKGRLSLWDDVQEIYMTAHLLGFPNTYTLSDPQLAQVKAKLLALKPNVRKFWGTTGEMGTLMATGEVVGGNSWEPTIVSLRKAGIKVLEVTPKEGRNGWSDSWMILKGASDNPCVYQWLNWTASAKAQALGYRVVGYGFSNAKMVGELDAPSRALYQELKLDDPNILKGVDWWQSAPRRGRYLEVWNQVKAN